MRKASLLLLALLASGCGGAGPDTSCRAARRTLEGYLKALKDGDCETAHAALALSARKQLSLEQLKKDYVEHRDLYRRRAEGKVDSVLYDDFRVIAKLVTGEGRCEFVSLVPEDGSWRIEETGRNYAHLYERIFAHERSPGKP